MQLNTYQSRQAPEVYVTMPTVEAEAIFSLVEELGPMRLTPLRCGYQLSEEPDLRFVEFVTFEIAATGYAVHGFHAAIRGAEAAP